MSQYQDVIGQFPLLKTYNHVIFGFELANDKSQDLITDTLKAASDKVIGSFPWLSGAVVNEGSGPGNSGTYKAVPWPATAVSPNEVVRVKDLSTSYPSFAEILKLGAPCSLLQGKDLASFPGFPASYEDTPEQPAPIVAIQANFVKGGVLINFSAQHNIIDASGVIQYVNLLATALRGGAFSASSLKHGNRDRSQVIPLMAPGEAVKDHSHLRRPIDQKIIPQRSAAAQEFIWAYFKMHRASISEIKALAEQRIDENDDADVPFISTGDALSAFYWKCLVSVRLAHGHASDAVSNYLRAIDARRAVRISQEYMGHAVYHSPTCMALQDVHKSSIASVARNLRRNLNANNTEHAVRSYCTFIASEPDKSRLMYGGLYNPALDIGSSAMPNIEFVEEFGPLAAPKFIRRPNLAPIPGCVYFTFPEGDYIPVLVCLKKEELAGLRVHPEWNRVTEYVG